MEVVASLSQGRTAAAQCGLFTYKSVPVIFEPPCMYKQDRNFCTLLKCVCVQPVLFCGRNGIIDLYYQLTLSIYRRTLIIIFFRKCVI